MFKQENISSNDKITALTDEHKQLIRETWNIASQPSVDAGLKLFKTLFKISPEAVTYFRNKDIEEDVFKSHINVVIATLDTAVNHLDDLNTLVPDLKKLGAFHGMLGIQRENFKAVKEALLSVLSEELREMFEDKCREAWSQIIDVITDVMISGMT